MSCTAKPGKRAKLLDRQASRSDAGLSPIAEASPAAATNAAAAVAAPPALPPDAEWFDPRDPEKVRAAKAVMHVAAAGAQLQQQPQCRGQQIQELEAIVEAALRDRSGCAIYVSGCPGSGKSLTVHSTARRLQQQRREAQEAAPQVIGINCMSLSQPGDVFARVSEELPAASGTADTPKDRLKLQLQLPPASPPSISPQKSAPKRRGRPRKPDAASGQLHAGMVIVILDELDRLLAHDQSILNDIFLLPQAPSSCLIMIGIANSIDLTERSLPQLQALGCKPALVTFPSYSSEELVKLLAQRQAQLPGPAFQEIALRLCARMVSTRSGDMRRALEACAAAIDQLVDDCAADAQQLPAELQASQLTMSQQGVTHRQVRLAQMSKAIHKCQGGSGQSSAVVATMKGLPQQQQLVLCALVLLLGKHGGAAAEAPGGFPATPVKTPLKLAQIASPKASPITPGKRKTPSGGSLKPYASSPYHTPKKPRLPSARSAKGLRSPVGKGTPGSGRALGSGRTLAGDAIVTLGTLHDSYTAMMHKVSMKPLSSMELAAACSTLADLGVVTLSRGGTSEERHRRIALQTNTGDAATALEHCRLAKDCLALSA